MSKNPDFESKHPRTDGGKFAEKPEVSAGISLTGPQYHSVDDPEFQSLTGPLPHLDGATVEYEDGRRAKIGILRQPTYTSAIATDPETGVQVPHYTPSDPPYRIVDTGLASAERVQDELEYVSLSRRAFDAAKAVDDQKDEMARYFDDRDTYQWSGLRLVYPYDDSPPAVGVYYSNEDGSRAGQWLMRDGTLTLARGSDGNSQRAKRIMNSMSTPEFAQAARDYTRLIDEYNEATEAYAAKSDELDTKYGRRM